MGESRPPGSPADRHPPSSTVPSEPTNALSPERYLAWLYSPPERQPVLGALCQIESEVASSLKPGIDHHVAHTRLQWWREECERTAEGRPVHPLTRELVRAFGAHGGVASDGAHDERSVHARGEVGGDVARAVGAGASISAADMRSSLAGVSGFVDAAVWDLAGATFETRKELTAYCERWATAMFGTAAATGRSAQAPAVAGSTQAGNPTQVGDPTEMGQSARVGESTQASEPARLRLRELGAAVREVELLAGLARDAHGGRLRVPLDELEQAGVPVSCLANPPWPAALETLLRERHEALRAAIAKGISEFGHGEQAPIRGLLVWAALAWRQSQRAQGALPNMILPRRYHALSDGWHAWRAARRATTGKLRLSKRNGTEQH